MKMLYYNNIGVLLICFFICESLTELPVGTSEKIAEWDYLMFSQRWPISSCAAWEDRSKNNTCTLPGDPSTWTIHGIWPSIIGAEGPYNCDSAIHFDPGQLEPLMDDLTNYWTNVEANTATMSFYKHEWGKHGTCASSLPNLNSVYNYFRKGLEMNRKYDLAEILAKGNVLPNDNDYTVNDIYDSIRSVLNKVPQIQCIVESNTKESLISEIRLCFDKSFELVDCNFTSNFVESNCNSHKPVKYLNKVPQPSQEFHIIKEYIDLQYYVDGYTHIESLTNVYRFLKFLIWVTL